MDGVFDFGRYKSARQEEAAKPQASQKVFARQLPKVYRVTGEMVDKPGTFVSSYTLAQSAQGLIKNPKFEQIKFLEPARDSGWLIVRHHPTALHLDIYLDNQMDFCRDKDDKINDVFDDDSGYYTLKHREAIPGAPDHLLIYVFKQDITVLQDGESLSTEGSTYYIYHPNGEVTNEFELLYPFADAMCI